MEASETLPPLSSKDSHELNLRRVLIERYELGVQRLTDNQIAKINDIGYDLYVISEMNNINKIGSKRYHRLCELSKIELTFELIIFHNFRDKLKLKNRAMIARLLAQNSGA